MKNDFFIIDKSQIVSVINQTFHFIDKRLVEHGERVAYIVWEMLKHSDESLKIQVDLLLILSVLHDIGAYKTKEIDEMVSFDSKEVWNHSIYGYLFLKNMSPLGDMAEAILYHHLDYKDYYRVDSPYLDYAALIYLADRLDILIVNSGEDIDFDFIYQSSGTRFKPEYVDLMCKVNLDEMVKNLRDGTYKNDIEEIIENIDISTEVAFEYLKMMAFSIDFRSEYTVAHTINTTAISNELGKKLNLSKEELSKIYVGALLHDIGKIAIDPDIVEFQGKLTPEQMEVMKLHVNYTFSIIHGVVDTDICNIATRHHEKLDGSGYPKGLKEAELTISEQIIAVADIVSALTSKRSYKEPFSKKKTLNIIKEMQEKNQLSYMVCQLILSDFDEIMRITDINRNPIIELYWNMQKSYVELSERLMTTSVNRAYEIS